MGSEIQRPDRRSFLVTSGMLAMAGGPAIAGAAAASGDHDHHTGKYAALIAEAMHCIETGNECAAHCIADMRSGNTELLECLVQVQELEIACNALAKFAAFDSEHLKTYAAATIEVCDTCEAECRKFEEVHTQCKACADACVACARECEKILT